MYEPTDFMDQADLNDFEVRQHLYAQRRLAEAESIDTRAAVEKMLARVEPKRQVCTMLVTAGAAEGEKAKRTICGQAGVRMIRLTGDWTCADHDPLRHPGPLVSFKGPAELIICEHRDGPWFCSAGLTVHPGPHIHSILGRPA